MNRELQAVNFEHSARMPRTRWDQRGRFPEKWLRALALVAAAGALHSQAWGWGDHRYATYRAFEQMPEVAQAQAVKVEPLSAFLKAEEKSVESLLNQQDNWAKTHLDFYPQLPADLAFKADPARTDEARQKAFLMGLRMAPDARMALYYQVDLRKERPAVMPLPHSAVNTLPVTPNTALSYFPLKAGDMVAPLTVLATASDEPDCGLDINLWEDSPSPWGKQMGFGPLPFGNPSLPYSTQAPFHMGFYHESKLIYLAAGFVKHTLPLMRNYQLSTLAELAFRTGHPYWGWRFSGMSLHYLQDLTQPFHASLSPGNNALKLIGINVLAMAGDPIYKDNMVILLSNRHLVLEYYQSNLMRSNALEHKDSAIELALRDTSRDASYPAWSSNYVHDISSAQAAEAGPALVDTLLEVMPRGYVEDPSFDFGSRADQIPINEEVARTATQLAQQHMEATIAQLMGNFGAHSRNAVRGILKASASNAAASSTQAQ